MSGQRPWDLFAYQRDLEASNLPAMVRHVLSVLMFTPEQGGDGFADRPNLSTPALGRRTGCTRRTVVRCLEIAEREGWIERIRRGSGRRTAYRLIMMGVIHSLTPDDTGTASNLHPQGAATCTPTTQDLIPQGPAVYPLLTKEPSIVERVRARVRQTCPDLAPDDDDLNLLITNLGNRNPHPVRNVAGYLQTCPPADVRRLLAELKTQVSAPTSTNSNEDAAPDCPHGNPGGLTSAGTPRCPQCRRAAQISRSRPFTPAMDGLDRPGGPKPADGLSAPLPEAVAG